MKTKEETLNNFKKNLLICGDNLTALNDLKKQEIKVDLIYLDPPFFSNKQHEVVWGDEAEKRSFEDRWAGGINVYIEWMKERIVKMYELLKDTGSFYLHCDWHAAHYLKVMLDEIFDHKNFQNEIIWYYKRWTNVSARFQRMHDTIFFYTKESGYTFNCLYQPFSDRTIHREISVDGITNLAEKRDITKGIVMHDIWDIPYIHSQAKERLGYPTQKPEALLERIIKASSNKGDLVLDSFCGCGTTIAIAQMLRRKWIGIDISPTAISVIEKRLEKLGAIKSKDFDTIGMPTTLSELRALEPFEFQNWVINEMKAKHSKKKVADMGIDGYYGKTIFTDAAGIQVKRSEKVGRNVVFNFETALRAGKYERGYIVAFSFTKGTYEEVARAKGDGLDIELIKVEDLLLRKIKI